MTFASIDLATVSIAVVTALVAARLRPTQTRALVPRAGPSRRAALVGAVAARSTTRWLRRRPVPASGAADWCDRLEHRMRSGSTVRDALISTVPGDPSARAATVDLRLHLERGLSTVEAVAALRSALADELPKRSREQHLDLVADAISVSAHVGGSSADAVARAATTLRLRSADRHERHAQAAQARLSAHVLTVVPLLVLALLVTTDESVRSTLTTASGAVLLGAGLLLNSAGWIWMGHITGVGR